MSELVSVERLVVVIGGVGGWENPASPLAIEV